MLIVVIAGGEDQKEFQDKQIPEGVQVQFVTTLNEAKDNADGYFYLLDTDVAGVADELQALKAPVFIKPGKNLNTIPDNVAVISPWPGFLFAEEIEVKLTINNMSQITTLLNKLQWKYNHVLIDANTSHI